MHRRRALKLFAGLALCPLCAANSVGEESHHWTYGGETGPDKWGGLDAMNAMCSAGSQESPVDIVDPIGARLPPLDIRWHTRPSARFPSKAIVTCGDCSSSVQHPSLIALEH